MREASFIIFALFGDFLHISWIPTYMCRKRQTKHKKSIPLYLLSLLSIDHFRCRGVELWVSQMVEELASREVQEGTLETANTLRLQANTCLNCLLAARREEIMGGSLLSVAMLPLHKPVFLMISLLWSLSSTYVSLYHYYGLFPTPILHVATQDGSIFNNMPWVTYAYYESVVLQHYTGSPGSFYP